MKLFRSIIGAVTGRGDEEKPWTFEPLKVEKELPLDEQRAAEQAKQIKLGYSVEMIDKAQGVRYTEGLRIVEAKISWDAGPRLFLNTLTRWTKPDPRDLTLGEFTKVLTRVAEYLTCDGKPLTLIDQRPALSIEETIVAEAVLPRLACWTRLERDSQVIEDRSQAAVAEAS